MSWIDRPTVRIRRLSGRLNAELRTGETFRYDTLDVVSEAGETNGVCPTLDHLVAAAGW